MPHRSPAPAVQFITVWSLAFFISIGLSSYSNAQTSGCLSIMESKIQSMNTIDMKSFDSENDTVSLPISQKKRLKFDYRIPEIQVENPEIIKATPVSAKEIVVHGLKPGISTLTVSNADKEVEAIQINVLADVSKLQKAFKQQLPHSNIKVTPLQTGIVLSGDVFPPETIEGAIAIARDYYPTNLINRLQRGDRPYVDREVFQISKSKLSEFEFKNLETQIKSVSSLIPTNSKSEPKRAQSQRGIVEAKFTEHIKILQQEGIAELILVDDSLNFPPANAFSGEWPLNPYKTIELSNIDAKLQLGPARYLEGVLTQSIRIDSQNTEQAKRRSRRSFGPSEKVKLGQTLAIVVDCPYESTNGDEFELAFLFTVKQKQKLAAKTNQTNGDVKR